MNTERGRGPAAVRPMAARIHAAWQRRAPPLFMVALGNSATPRAAARRHYPKAPRLGGTRSRREFEQQGRERDNAA